MMLPPSFDELVNAPAPGFQCTAAGRESNGTFVARVRHILNRPASAEAVDGIRRGLGKLSPEIVDFYRQHNGLLLFQDTLSESAGFELLPAELWDEATEDMRDWFSHLADEPENDPDRIVTGTAIATVPESGNYFVMPSEGPSAGKIFYADHDGWYESAFADSFTAMLLRLAENPVHLLNEVFGCYTRYSDGKSDTQWIPETYYPDVAQIKA